MRDERKEGTETNKVLLLHPSSFIPSLKGV
jgi:hypothetical protein